MFASSKVMRSKSNVNQNVVIPFHSTPQTSEPAAISDETAYESDLELEESRLWSKSESSLKNGVIDDATLPMGPYLDEDNAVFQTYWNGSEERAIVKKFDRRLVFFVAFLYLLSFLDRSNIGNARIAGLETDLQLTSDQYSWILTSFYITYIMFEWMSVLWRIIPAHIYVTIIVLSWGLVASLQSCATSFLSLVCLRMLLGIGEAAYTGIPYYLSFFYKREELALRLGLFISSAPLATAIASTLAWAIVRVAQFSSFAPWRLLFLVEGFPSVVIAVVAYSAIPDGPGKTTYLNKRERRIARLRLEGSSVVTRNIGHYQRLSWWNAVSVIIDPKCFIIALIFFGTNMSFSSMPVFLPTVIKGMGHSNLISQALAAPPYLLAFVVVIYTAWLSDRAQARASFIVFHALLSASGYLLLASSERFALGNWWRYAAIYPVVSGFFSVVAITITWNINNQNNQSKQGAAFAVMQLVGQCGPLIGIRLYPDTEAPYYTRGMGICGFAMALVALLALGLKVYLRWQNVFLGTKKSSNPGFRYMI